MPSSLTEVLPSTSVCSTCPPVSVCGTVTPQPWACALASGFSRQSRINPSGAGSPPCLPLASRSTPPWICLRWLPTGLEGLAPPGPTSLRPRITSEGLPSTVGGGTGLFARCPSPAPRGLGLGPPHPQLISMAAEPLGIRWGGFAPPSRYSCRHSHSPPLHGRFRSRFAGDGDAPLPRAAQASTPASDAHPRRRCRA